MRLVTQRAATALAGAAAIGLMGLAGAGTATAAAPVSHPNAQSAGHAPAKPNCKTDKTNPACMGKKGKKKS
jgi:hypothetical protein